MCKLRQKYLVRSRAFTLVELMISMGLLTFVIFSVFGLLGQAQKSFFASDTGIDIRSSLRLASEKMALELRNTGYKASGVGSGNQYTITDNTGVNGSDIIRFSIPVLCSSTSTLLDSNGVPAYWGAPLTWGCNSYTCMDQNGVCATVEYKYVQYSINSSNQLERKVLNPALGVVSGSTTIIGKDIVNLQITVSGSTMTFVLTGQKKSQTGRTLTATYSNDVLLNNMGG